MQRLTRPLLTAAVLGLACWYVVSRRDDFSLILDFDWYWIPVMAGLAILSLVTNGWVLASLVASLGVRLHWVEWFGLTTLGSLGNYLPIPQAGPAARGVYLRRVHDLPLSSYAGTVIAMFVLALSVQGFVGLAGLVFVSTRGAAPDWPLWLAFAVCAAACVALLAPLPGFLAGRDRVRRFHEGFETLRRGHLLWRLALLHLAQTLLGAVSLWIAFIGIDRAVDFSTCLLLMAIVLCSGVFNVTPGNIGVSESAAWITARMLGENADQAVVAFAIQRAVGLLTLLALAPVFTATLKKRPPSS